MIPGLVRLNLAFDRTSGTNLHPVRIAGAGVRRGHGVAAAAEIVMPVLVVKLPAAMAFGA